MSSKETPNHYIETTEDSGWGTLADELAADLQEAADLSEVEQDEAAAKKAEAEAEEQRRNKELSDLVKEVISLRGGADSIKEGTWDNDQKAYIGENGLPTDYAHLMHYLKENPDAVETLTQERDSLLANVEDEGGKYSEESFDDYMRKFANPFADDPLAAEIAETNLPLEGETGEQYEARIRRNAELFRAAEKEGPRDAAKESLESYNERIAKGVDERLDREATARKNRDIILHGQNYGTTEKVVTRDKDGKPVEQEGGRVDLDPSRPIMSQILDKEGRQWVRDQLSEMYPRNEAESISEWQSRVESEIGLKIWKNTEQAGGAAAGTGPEGGAGSGAPEGGDGAGDAGNGEGSDNPGGKGGNGPEPFPRSTAFANNRYKRWYEMNRENRNATAAEGQAAAAEGGAGEGDAAEGGAAEGDTADGNAAEGGAKPITNEGQPAGAAEANPAEQNGAAAKNEKGKKHEFGEKAKEISAKLDALYSSRWKVLVNAANRDIYKQRLDDATGFFKRKLREELQAKIDECTAEIEDVKSKYGSILDGLKDAYAGAELSNYELAQLRKLDKNYAEHAGQSNDDGVTKTFTERLAGAKRKLENWKKELEQSIARKDKKYIELHTENVESAQNDYDFANGILHYQEQYNFGPVMDKLDQYKAEMSQKDYEEAIQAAFKFRKETQEAAEKLPEDERKAYMEAHKPEFIKLCAQIGEKSRPSNIAAAEKCTSAELANEWRDKVSRADALYTFFVYRRVVDILPAISSGNLAAAKREYDKSPNDDAKADIDENLKKYFGATDEFIAQLRGTDGEEQTGAA